MYRFLVTLNHQNRNRQSFKILYSVKKFCSITQVFSFRQTPGYAACFANVKTEIVPFSNLTKNSLVDFEEGKNHLFPMVGFCSRLLYPFPKSSTFFTEHFLLIAYDLFLLPLLRKKWFFQDSPILDLVKYPTCFLYHVPLFRTLLSI